MAADRKMASSCSAAYARSVWVLRACLLVAISWVAVSPTVSAESFASDPRDAELSAVASAALDEMLGDRSLRGARVGVIVADLDSGAVLLQRHAARTMVPASNLKLLVGAAALDYWGSAHRFETRVLTERAPDARGVIEGPLWVIGAGDPSLVSESLWKLAEEIRLRGVTEIRGGISVDASFFDGVATHPDWEPLTRRAYEAPTSAFAANYSSFRIEVSAAPQQGGPVRILLAPRLAYFRTRSGALTVRHAEQLRLDIEELPDGTGELVRLTGTFPLGAESKTYWRSVAHPERYAASLLRAQLETHGVRVSGSLRFGSAPAGGVELLRFKGEPVGRIVVLLNKWSNNFVAEQLTKLLGAHRYGAPGSWKSGMRALRAYLDQLGVPAEQAVIADGSGLSARNRISPNALLQILRASARSRWFGPEFLASLPLAHQDGTLEDRMAEVSAPLRGKTGHLRHVSSLTGVTRTGAGRQVAFSVVVNGARGNRLDVDRAMDRFVADLGGDSEAPAAVSPAAPGEPNQSASGDRSWE
jgi:D-alanyl-D-alanine carboxypeptidase/D-alanyl-D-alanine-endopeptidase (penicillin-binding protein 4)